MGVLRKGEYVKQSYWRMLDRNLNPGLGYEFSGVLHLHV